MCRTVALVRQQTHTHTQTDKLSTIPLAHAPSVNNSEPSKVSLLGLESRFVWLLGVYVSQGSKFSFLLSSATQAMPPSVSKSKAIYGIHQDGHARPLLELCLPECSWPKVVRPVSYLWGFSWPILGFIVSRLTTKWTVGNIDQMHHSLVT